MVAFDSVLAFADESRLNRHGVGRNGEGRAVGRAAAAVPIAYQEDEPLHAECVHILECVQGRVPSRSDAEDGLRVLTACQRALATRMPANLTTELL